MNEQQLKLRYRKRPFMTLLMFLLVAFFGSSLFFIDFYENKWIYIMLVLLFFFLLFGLISQLILWGKEYHFIIDKIDRKIFIDNGLRKSKVIDLDDVLGMAYDSVTVKSNTTYTLQFKVMPRVWGEYYNKKSRDIAQVEENYRYMFISIGIVNQKEEDIQQLVSYLHECGLDSIEFQKTTLGKTHGIIKKHSIDTQSKEYKKLVYKQWLSYFFKWLLILYLIFYFICQLLGRINGIYW